MSETLLNTEQPTLTTVLDTALRAFGAQLRVAMPGRVESYDSSTHLATVQPLLQRRRGGAAAPSTLPVLPRVPVIHPRTAAGAVYLPLAQGDMVTLLFSDRSLDRWKASTGSVVEPQPKRMHDLADCWAIPGGYPEAMPPEQQYPDALEVQVASGTKVAIHNGTEELIDLMYQFMDYVETTITFSNGGGPTGPPTNSSLLNAIKLKLEQFKAT